MTTKVKGLLKGLRYISHVFDEKEEEIQIGFPTDVKHVAHIGSDDPSANAPSWMTEFKGTQEPSSGTANSTDVPEDNKNSKGSRHIIPKSKHHTAENPSQKNSSNRRSSEGVKHTRRHRSSDPSSDSSTRDSSSSSRHLRRPRPSSNQGAESLSQELPAEGSKHSHRRKSKTTTSDSGDGSVTKPSRTRRSSKADSLSDISLSDFGSESGHGSK